MNNSLYIIILLGFIIFNLYKNNNTLFGGNYLTPLSSGKSGFKSGSTHEQKQDLIITQADANEKIQADANEKIQADTNENKLTKSQIESMEREIYTLINNEANMRKDIDELNKHISELNKHKADLIGHRDHLIRENQAIRNTNNKSKIKINDLNKQLLDIKNISKFDANKNGIYEPIEKNAFLDKHIFH